MRIQHIIILLGTALALATTSAHAQYEVMTQGPISLSQTLTGHADIGVDKAPAEGVTVELRSSGWRKILSSTKIDSKGRFAIGTPEVGRLYYIRLSGPGLNPYQLRVRISKNGSKELTIHLSNAT